MARTIIGNKRITWPMLLVVLSAMAIRPGEAQQVRDIRRAGGGGKTWALLVGVEKYQKAPPLRFTGNDVGQLAETLADRAGIEPRQILRMTDHAEEPGLRPMRENLLTAIPRWLEQAGPEDRLIVYFSGHGFRDSATGQLYLAPVECDPARPAETSIPVQWLREQIAGCKAGLKLLLLDTCHAGSEKGEPAENLAHSSAVGERFRDLEGVVTIASSTGEESSIEWDQRRQGLFSYWLVQAFRGHADESGDGTVDIDELYSYVHRNVRRTATRRFKRPQTPVRIVRSGTVGVPQIVRLTPQNLRTVIRDMAEQLAIQLEESDLDRVGVLEFTADSPLGEVLGTGLLGRWCAEELERGLTDLGSGQLRVVDRRRLQSALTAQSFALKDLGSFHALQRLAEGVGQLPVLALGMIRSRLGAIIHLQCKLTEVSTGDVIGSAAGRAQLTESDWAMLGQSVAVRPDDRRPQLLTGDQPPTTETQIIERLDQRADGPHPLLDPAFPFAVRLKIAGKVREGVASRNDYLVPVSEGEVYEIEIENRTPNVVCLRLLVDGLNTLPEPTLIDGAERMVWGKRVRLEDARHWVLDPAVSKRFAIRGFVTETGADGTLREFTISRAEKSLAGRQEYTDQLGLITAAFYAPASASRRLGTAAGKERSEDLTESKAIRPGNLLGVVHLRYVSREALEEATR